MIWTLILIFTGGGAFQPDPMVGFASQAACEESGRIAVSKGSTKLPNVKGVVGVASYVCIAVR